MADTETIFSQYITSISSKFSHTETSEYGYRTDFENLLKEVFASENITRFDHDAKTKQGNKPDFVVVKNDVPLLYIETKDIGVSLDKVEKSEQMARYFGYANLVLTDYVEFRFYRDGLPYGDPIQIAEYDKRNRTITPYSENYDYLKKTLVDFVKSHKEPIKSGQHLAKIMGGKGQRIRDNIRDILASESGKKTELMNVYQTLKRLLVHDLTTDSFADMYAQTLVYGLFVARFYDNSLSSFSRQEARDLIPSSNPFLGHFFDHIAGRNFEKRLSYIVDELCNVFSHANVAELMEQHFKSVSKKGAHRGQDQVIHFYEDFLKEYDEDLRKRMGAYYTPLPVVQFIVRSVDYLLEKEFGLNGGLASTEKTDDGLHKVQILDPAVGTGTFMSDVIGKIYTRIKDAGQKGRWPAYVHHELLPRIYGFELMMAPYTIAHLKLSMALKETGFLYFNETRTGKARLGIYLTNSLEEVNQQPDLLAFDFGASIAEEAKEAAKIKNDKPIMVVIGNPPYSGESSNKDYSGHDVYKVEPGGKEKLKERNSKWINDDYVKFIRFAESMVEKNGEGIVAMITAHGYIDNPTFRGMRWHLMKTFDEIYVLDLHGNSNKKESAPDGGPDENVFDIRTGVAIIFAIKGKSDNNDLASIHKADLYGKRNDKFEFLDKKDVSKVKYVQINPVEPNYEWVDRDEKALSEYNKGFSIDELFPVNVLGYQTHRDNFAVSIKRNSLTQRLIDFEDTSLSDTQIISKYDLNVKSWDISASREEYKRNYSEQDIQRTLYRPFDFRFVVLNKAICDRPRNEILQNVVGKENICLLVSRQQATVGFHHTFLTNLPANDCVMSTTSREANQVFPLYLYGEEETKSPNLNLEIVEKIESIVDKTEPEEIFDYVYAVLHSPSYREKYNEFLRIDFPRVPYPKNKDTFKKLVKLGQELRELHLLESSKVNNFITTYPVAGTDVVEKPTYKDGNVYINDEQYFGNVPEVAWNFWIGGYQPARKWLKYRKGQQLTNEDIEHYQKIMVALVETDRLMKEIDKVKIYLHSK